VRDILDAAEKRLKLNEYETARFENTGYVRWESILQFYSIGLVKAGWLVKKKGVWYVTPEGTDALKLSARDFIDVSNKKYYEWKKMQPPAPTGGPEPRPDPPRPPEYEQAVGLARAEIRAHIAALDAYSFQDPVAALLRAMGYHTPFIAPKGPDGGIDILAYRDPFGTQNSRIKVLVKHRMQKANVQEVRQLSDLLNKDGDTGLFVSSGGFTDDALDAIRNAPRHIEKLDLDTLIDLWDEYYEKMDEEYKSRMPLRHVAFLAPLD